MGRKGNKQLRGNSGKDYGDSKELIALRKELVQTPSYEGRTGSRKQGGYHKKQYRNNNSWQ